MRAAPYPDAVELMSYGTPLGPSRRCDAPRVRGARQPTPATSTSQLFRICIYRQKITLSTMRAGQRVGIKEVDDGMAIVGFTR